MRKYLLIMEKANRNYSAYSPDLPGCIATGKTVKDTKKKLHGAITLHLTGIREDKIPIPKSSSIAEYVVIQR